ncbi:MAG: MotA/TolQ/ExbB proton channel family protein [Pirellulales bacterium]
MGCAIASDRDWWKRWGGTLICFPMRAVRRLPAVVMKGVSGKLADLRCDRADCGTGDWHGDGLLALEPRLTRLIEDPFIRLGVQMAIDGTRPELLEEVLQTEMETMQVRHREGKGAIDQLGRYAPAFGMIGTLVGLITMLSNMSGPFDAG